MSRSRFCAKKAPETASLSPLLDPPLLTPEEAEKQEKPVVFDTFSILVNLGGPQKRFKISSFCRSKILKKQLVFIAFLSSRGAQDEVKKVSFLVHNFIAVQKHRF